ncbi:hypothetical protein LO772_00135 [Yinghuangia sp. ASG 101]|nr:hypothetical protein [Yinghuangia sp. ASG 101]UGQ12063.1 hypothetical protein LO772_00135 [Yinghuangia sp. ASG 101]
MRVEATRTTRPVPRPAGKRGRAQLLTCRGSIVFASAWPRGVSTHI